MLDEIRDLIKSINLDGVINFHGFVSDRTQILDFLRDIDVFVFCHTTPESPRCLIEPIISGTPLVGYSITYAQDLVGNRVAR